MITQWENEWISLAVLSMTRVMIAQWENEWISLAVLSVTRVMLAQWENECISLSVFPVARVMIAQWDNGCISDCPRGPGSIPGHGGGFQKNFSLSDNTSVSAESLLITLPGKRWVKDSVGQFLHHFWQLLCYGDKKKLTELLWPLREYRSSIKLVKHAVSWVV